MAELLGDLLGEERPQLLAAGSLHHAGVEPVHDHGLELAAQVLVESIDERHPGWPAWIPCDRLTLRRVPVPGAGGR